MKHIFLERTLFKLIVFMSLILMMSSCKKNSEDSSFLPGDLVNVNIKANFDDYSAPISNKVSNVGVKSSMIDTVINLGDGNIMTATMYESEGSSEPVRLVANTMNKLKRSSASNIENLSVYKIFLFTKNPDKFVEERTYVAGKESETEVLRFQLGVEYTVVGISLNDRSSLDSYVVRKGEKLSDFIFKLQNTDDMANKDMMFVSRDVYVPPGTTGMYDLSLDFKHLFNMIDLFVEADYNDFGNYMSSINLGLNVRGHKGVEKQFSANDIVRPSSDTYYLQMPPFSGLGTSSVINSSTIVNTASTKGTDQYFVTIKSLVIGSRNYSNLNYFKNYDVLPGKKYTLRVKLTAIKSDVSVGGNGNVLVEEEGQQTKDKNLVL